ncbi:hypothetical protein Q9966_015765 [Columba livia]|nr:hypothetical protein Q9966_015765 [Columba livia]
MPAACDSVLEDIEDIVSAEDLKPHDRQFVRKNIFPKVRKRNSQKNIQTDDDPPSDSIIPGVQKIWIRTWGCSHNNSDGEYMAGQLAAYGYKITDNSAEADLWLLNSCTVKNPAEDHFRNSIKLKLRSTPSAFAATLRIKLTEEPSGRTGGSGLTARPWGRNGKNESNDFIVALTGYKEEKIKKAFEARGGCFQATQITNMIYLEMVTAAYDSQQLSPLETSGLYMLQWCTDFTQWKAQEGKKKVVLAGCVPQAQPRQDYLKGLSIIGMTVQGLCRGLGASLKRMSESFSYFHVLLSCLLQSALSFCSIQALMENDLSWIKCPPWYMLILETRSHKIHEAKYGAQTTSSSSVRAVQQIDRVVEVVEETIKGHSVRLLGQKKDNGKRLGGARLDLPKIRKNPLIEIISINTGCLNACTYCKTKHARGDLASYPIEELVDRAKQSFQGCGVRDDSHEHVSLSDSNQETYALLLRMS